MPPDDTSILRQQNESEPESQPVGVGPTYDPIRAAAADLLPLFAPSEWRHDGRWGAGLLHVDHLGDEHRVWLLYPVVSRWQKARNSIETMASVQELRATGIALLAYCESIDPLGQRDCPCASHPHGGHYPSCPITLAENAAASGQKGER